MKTYTKDSLIQELVNIRNREWIENLRSGNAGSIGNTLEDLLGIEENNLPIPNAYVNLFTWNTYKPKWNTYKPKWNTYKPKWNTYKPKWNTYKPTGNTYKPTGNTYRPDGKYFPTKWVGVRVNQVCTE